MSNCPMAHPSSFLDPEIQKNPFEFYRRLRHEAPVYWDAETSCFVLSKYQTIQAVCLDTATFSNVGTIGAGSKAAVADEVAAIRATTWPGVPMLVTNDPPSHTEYRALSNKLLSQKRMKAMEPFIVELTTRLIGQMADQGGGEFMQMFAIPMPVAVICEMLGVPEQMWAKCKEWSDALVDPLSGMASAEREIECAHLYVERQTWFAAQIESIRRDGGTPDKLMTEIALVRKASGEQLSMPEALSLIEQYLIAGNETTTSLLGMGALVLVQQPELAQQIGNDETKLATFVEEMLRLYSPSQAQPRIALKDAEIEGVRIPRGSRLMLRSSAANRDEDVFADAEQVDLCRNNPRLHLGFGHGIHTCQGATLARIESIAAFGALIRNVRGLRLADRPDAVKHLESLVLMGLTELHLQMQPK